MIDTEKYEGHTPAEHWSFSLWGFSMPTGFDADARLIADAPLLLEEVKQIHEILREAFSIEAKHSGAEYLNMIARVTGLIE